MNVTFDTNNHGVSRKAIQLIEFIKALEAMKSKDLKLSINDCLKSISVNDVPETGKYIYNKLNISNLDELETEVIDDEECKIILEVFKVNRIPCPEPPPELKSYLVENWNSSRTVITSNKLVSLIVEADDEVDVNQVDKWIGLRNRWVEEDSYLCKIDLLFSKLQQINNAIQSDPDKIEFILGNAVINNLDKSINYPLIYTKVRIRYIPEKNSIQLYCPSNSVKFSEELSYSKHDDLTSLDWSNLVSFKQETELMDFVVGDSSLDSIVTNNCRLLDPNIKFFSTWNDVVEYTNMELYIVLEPILVLRNVNTSNLGFLNKVEESLEHNILSGALIDIVVGENQSTNSQEIEIRSDWGAINGQSFNVFFTKPANRAQLEIVDYINHNKSVVVQGPPGTGKTHTIANLIGHYLSQGKTILVTSSTSKALGVLRDKLPKEIRPLCVPLLDQSETEISKAIEIISEQLQQYNSEHYRAQIKNLINEYEHTYAELERYRKKLFSIKCKENRYLSIQNKPVSIKSIVETILNISTTDFSYWNNINPQLAFPLSNIEYNFLVEYTSKIRPTLEEAHLLLQKSDIKIEDIPVVDSLENNYRLKKSIDNELECICYVLNDILENEVFINSNEQSMELQFDSKLVTSDIISEFKYIAQNRTVLTEPYWIELAGDALSRTEDTNQWHKLYDSVERGIVLYNAYYETGLNIEDISIDNETITIESKNIISHIENLITNPPSFISRLLKSINVEAECARIRIKDKSISSIDECKQLYCLIDYMLWKESFASLWDDMIGKYIEKYSFLSILSYTKGRNVALWCKEHVLNEIETAKSWYQLSITPVVELFNRYGIRLSIKDSILTTPATRVQNLINNLEKLEKAIFDFDDLCNKDFVAWKANDIEIEKRLSDLVGKSNNQITESIFSFYKKNDFNKYRNWYDTLVYAIKNTEKRVEYDRILGDLDRLVPEWSNFIRDNDTLAFKSYEEMQSVWYTKQCEISYQENFNDDYESLLKQIKKLSELLFNLAKQIVVKKSWYERAYTTADNKAVHTALASWVTLIKKIGKGTGKSAPMYRKQAIEQLSIAKDAIPCWIMPINKIYNTIDPSSMKFDLIIVDEASQADINALPILALGDKVIVVGDDKQVSPSGIVKIKDEEIHSLQNNYLSCLPNRVLFDFKTSLYEFIRPLSRQVLLKEHFRCVSAIINYSNKYYYDNNIIPLRDDSISPLKTPIVPIYVDGFRDGNSKINKHEAEYIVASIEACFNNSSYDGLSFGIISLLGNEQSEYIYNLITERCDPADIEKHSLICGDAAQFQGDERDVIFLSLVDAKQLDSDNEFLRKIDNSNITFRQRFNVAVSRAKNQIWVIYSMHPDSLRNDDIRKNLLYYCENYGTIEILKDEVNSLSESPFECEVATYLINKGYSIKQQYPVGNYRLDMIVEYDNNKIAIECDGEAYHSTEEQIRRDLERQTILDRIGWSFIRIRGSEYYKAKDNTLQALDSRLKSMGFYPEKVEGDNNVSDSVVDAIKQEATRLCSVYQMKYNNGVERLKLSEKPKNDYKEFDSESMSINDNKVEESNRFKAEEEFIGEKHNSEDALSERLKPHFIRYKQDILNRDGAEIKSSKNDNITRIPKVIVSSEKLVSNSRRTDGDKQNRKYNQIKDDCESITISAKSTNKDIYIFGNLGYITKLEYEDFLAEGQRKASGRQKNFFNNNMIKVGAMVYNDKYGIGAIDAVDKAQKYVKVIFSEVNKYETFIRPTCFTQEKLILLRGRLRSML